MTSSISNYPTIILFERHWDTTPKKIIRSLIPKLAHEGYDSYCMEASSDLTKQEFALRLKHGVETSTEIYNEAMKLLKNNGVRLNKELSDISYDVLLDLMRYYVSSQKYEIVAEKIKSLPAYRIFNENFSLLKTESIDFCPIDIKADSYDQMIKLGPTERMKLVDRFEENRIQSFVTHLLKLRSERKGVVFSLGAIHATNLIAKLHECGQHDNFIYYFPHSSKHYVDGIDDVNEYLTTPVLEKQKITLDTDSEIESFVKKLISEVQARNTHYIEEVAGGNSQAAYLSEFFKVEFKAFKRLGHYVDLLLDISTVANGDEIARTLSAADIPARISGRNTLIISNVNTQMIGDRIQKFCCERLRS